MTDGHFALLSQRGSAQYSCDLTMGNNFEIFTSVTSFLLCFKMYPTSLSSMLIRAHRKAIKPPQSLGPSSDRRLQCPLHELASTTFKSLPSQRCNSLVRQTGQLLSDQQLGQSPVFHLCPKIFLPQWLPLFPVNDGQTGEIWPQQAGYLCHCEGKVGREVTQLWDPSVHLPALSGNERVHSQVVTVEDGHFLENVSSPV